MKPGIGLALVLLIFAQNVFAARLNDLIKQNVYDTTRIYDKQSIATEQQKVTPRLWIHVRSKEQHKAVLGALDRFKRINLNGRALELRTIQLVNSGPQDSQLRYFRKQDKDEAVLLLKELQKMHSPIRLQDMSARYKGMEAVNAGHYELWLAPDVSKFNTP